MAQTVTLYIEDAEIKLLVCNGKQIVKWASLMIDPKLVRDGVILDEETVAREIKKLFETTGTKDKKVIAALSGLNSVFRIITLPAAVPQSILDEAIENEAQRVLPVSIDQVYLSYQRISYDKEESHYFLVAHPKNSTDALIRTINSAGLKPQSMDLAPLALARCANEPKAVIVNSWLTYVDIIVMSESIPQVIRTLSLPTDSVALEDKLPLISEEIVRTIAFYNTSFASKALDAATPLLVCGDLTYNEEKLKEILGVLEHPIVQLTPPFPFAPDFPSCQYMVNAGMFLKGRLPKNGENHYSIVEIDALPKAYQPPSFSLKRVFSIVAVFVALMALVLGGIMLWNAYNKTAKLQNDYNLLQAEIASLNSDITALGAESDALNSESESIAAEVTAKSQEALYRQELINIQIENNLEPIEDAETAALMQRLLDAITISMEKTNSDMGIITGLSEDIIDVTLITYTVDEATISGIAASEKSVFEYADALQNSGQFSTVLISSISNETNTLIFQIKLLW